VTAPLTLDAITMHTYYGVAATFDAPLCWCVRFSDVLEPYRDWSGVRWLRDGLGCFCKEVYSGRLAEAALLQSGWLVQWFDECNIPVHPNMRRIYHELSARLGVDESFLG
jgi:HD superfamily phosphohydrolase YqeK